MLLWFLRVAEGRVTAQEYAALRPRVYLAIAVDLAIPVVGWFLMKWFNRRRQAKQ